MLSPEFPGFEPAKQLFVPDNLEGLCSEENLRLHEAFNVLDHEIRRINNLKTGRYGQSFHMMPIEAGMISVFITQLGTEQGVVTRAIVNTEVIGNTGDTDIFISDFLVLPDKEAVAVLREKSRRSKITHELDMHDYHGPYLQKRNNRLEIVHGENYGFDLPECRYESTMMERIDRRILAEELLGYLSSLNTVTREEGIALPYK